MKAEIKNKIENIIRHNGDWSGYALQDEINELLIMCHKDYKDREEKYKEALIWCSGSEDFQLEGKARKGWEKICIPLLK